MAASACLLYGEAPFSLTMSKPIYGNVVRYAANKGSRVVATKYRITLLPYPCKDILCDILRQMTICDYASSQPEDRIFMPLDKRYIFRFGYQVIFCFCLFYL